MKEYKTNHGHKVVWANCPTRKCDGRFWYCEKCIVEGECSVCGSPISKADKERNIKK